MQTLRCDVASAAVESAEVRIHFGERETREGGAAGVRQAHTLALAPHAAKRLHELLALLVGEHDRRRGGA